jgi:hypothetical protein
MMTKRELKTATKKAAARAKTAGKVAALKIVDATDEMLAEVGRAAERRQRRRTMTKVLKVAGKAALVAGGATAAAVAVRAGVRRFRGRKPATA